MVSYETGHLNENLEGIRSLHKESIGPVWVWIMCVFDEQGCNKGLKLNSAVTRSETNGNTINTNFGKYIWGSLLILLLGNQPSLWLSTPTTLGTWTHTCCILCAFYISSLCSECSFLPFLTTSTYGSHLLCAFFYSTFTGIANHIACWLYYIYWDVCPSHQTVSP